MVKTIYVASSWRNDGPLLDEAHQVLRSGGFNTFDFRVGGRWWHGLPDSGCPTDRWNQPDRVAAFERDFRGLRAADGTLLVLPAGTDSHIEAAWASGRGQAVVVWGDPREGTYELMLKVVLKDGGIVLPPSAPIEDVVETFKALFASRESKIYTCPYGCEHEDDS